MKTKWMLLIGLMEVLTACQTIPTVIPTLPSEPTLETTSPTGFIIYCSEDSGSPDLFRIDLPEGEPVRLTHSPSLDISPNISRDGSQITFISDRSGAHEVYSMPSEGGDVIQLTFDGVYKSDPAWSPDGTLIAFVAEYENNRDIYLMNADGSNIQRLTSDPVEDMHPTWSPDGQSIIFNTRLDGIGDLYRIDLHTEMIVPLTETEDFEFYASWSPDGERIAYTYTQGPGTRIKFAITDMDGGNRIEISGGGFVIEHPRWSPDSEWIVFTSNRTGLFEIYIMRADGSEQAQITSTSTGAYWPTWGP